MAAQGNAAAGGLQVGFRRHSILLVAELVARVGDQLSERHTEVRFTGGVPGGQKLFHPVQDQSAEASVIFGQVIDRRRNRRAGWALRGLGSALKIRTTLDLKKKFHLGQLGIESAQNGSQLKRILLGLSDIVYQPER